PISLITSHALLVEAGKKRYASPTQQLEQILPPDSGTFREINNKLSFRFEDRLCNVMFLSTLLTAQPSDAQDASRKAALIVRHDEHTSVVLVDRVLSSHEFVVKPTGRFLARPAGIGGLSTLGDGSVVTVVDMPELLRRGSRVGSSAPVSTVDVPRHTTTKIPAVEAEEILIVDDSLSVRRSLQDMCEGAGFKPVLARDGLDAIQKLKKHRPVAALVDLEMPNMNGLELTSHVRASAETQDLPVIMITSRTQKKHRDMAREAGVTHYVTKPYVENALVDLIRSAIGLEVADIA
ncbi:MAG: response regulator, partial [Pseudomonadota bacterium]